MACTVELICTGNELLTGRVLNTNARRLSALITKLGGKVRRIVTVGDDLNEISTAVKEGLKRRPDFIITLGGLGPTPDDLTLEAVAKALKLPLKLNEAALSFVKESYLRLSGKEMELTKPRLKMAMLPKGAIPLRNRAGVAPAVLIKRERTTIVCLPGVPREAEGFFKNEISKLILEKAGGTRFYEARLILHGVTESEISYLIEELKRNQPNVYLKSRVMDGEFGRSFLELHFSTFSASKGDGRRKILGAMFKFLKELAGSRSRTRVNNH